MACDVIYIETWNRSKTWFVDQVNDDDAEYLLATPKRAAADEMYEALLNADYAVWYMANHGPEGDMIDWEERFEQLTNALALVDKETT